MRFELDGIGICSGIWDSEAITRAVEEARKKEAELDAGCAEAQATCDAIDKMLDQSLKHELNIEMSRVKLTPRQKQDFAEFKEFSEGMGIRALPAAPQVVTLFLIERGLKKGAQVAQRVRDSIAAVHRVCNFENPTDDVATRAALRRLRAIDKDDPTPQEKERV
jgi:hypothetical protein